jgi:hypothetical protein
MKLALLEKSCLKSLHCEGTLLFASSLTLLAMTVSRMWLPPSGRRKAKGGRWKEGKNFFPLPLLPTSHFPLPLGGQEGEFGLRVVYEVNHFAKRTLFRHALTLFIEWSTVFSPTDQRGL